MHRSWCFDCSNAPVHLQKFITGPSNNRFCLDSVIERGRPKKSAQTSELVTTETMRTTWHCTLWEGRQKDEPVQATQECLAYNDGLPQLYSESKLICWHFLGMLRVKLNNLSHILWLLHAIDASLKKIPPFWSLENNRINICSKPHQNELNPVHIHPNFRQDYVCTMCILD